MGTEENLLSRMNTQYHKFSKGQKKLVSYITDNYDKVPQSEILDTVLRADIEKIKLTMENIDHNAFELAVETILEAKSIYIVGIRSCAPLASFLGFYFNLLFDNVHLMHTNSSSELFEQMIHISKDDVIIGISFPRY